MKKITNKNTVKKVSECSAEFFCRQVIMVIFAFFVILVVGGCVFKLGSRILFENSFFWECGVWFASIGIILMIWKSTERITFGFKRGLLIVWGVAVLLRVLTVSLWHVVPLEDFALTFDAAEMLSNSEFADMPFVLQKNYSTFYDVWPAHIPFVFSEMFVIQIFGANPYAMKIVFGTFGALSCVAAALIGKELYNEKIGFVIGLVMAVMPVNLFYSAVLSNQHIATFFFLMATYFVIISFRKNPIRNIVWASLCTAASQLIRPEMIVFVIAVVCFLICKIFCLSRDAVFSCSCVQFLKKVLLFVGIYFIVINSVDCFLMHNKLSAKSMNDVNVKYKIATGLCTESNGKWKQSIADIANDEEKLDKMINDELADMIGILKLGSIKIADNFASYNYPWLTKGLTLRTPGVGLSVIVNMSMALVLLSVLMGVKSVCASKNDIFLKIILIGYFMTFFVIEIQSRYNYMFISLFCILAGPRLECFYLRVKNLCGSLRRRRKGVKR